MFRAEISSCNFHLIAFCKNEDQKTQKSVRDDSNISSDIKFDKIFETLLLTARTTDVTRLLRNIALRHLAAQILCRLLKFLKIFCRVYLQNFIDYTIYEVLKINTAKNAEEALMRHVQDQNLCVTKLSNQLEEAHFESSAFQEKLKETTSKLSEAKIKLEEYQHKESKIDSENVSKLNEKLSILQSDLDLKSFLVTRKESKIIELEQKVTNLEDYIKTTEFEIMRKISRDDEVISNLQNKCDELTKEKQKLVIFTESKTAISQENDKINFDNSEQTDSFRCAAATAETETPRFIENITNEFPITKMSPPSDDDNSANSMINMSDILKAPNFDDVSANLSSMQEPTVDVVTVTDSKNSTAKRVETSSNADDDNNNSVGGESNRGMKVQLEEFWTQLLQLKEENSNLKSQLRQAEHFYASLQTRSYDLEKEKELKTLLDTKEEKIDSLKIQLKHREESYNEMRNRLNDDLENRNVELVSLKADLKVLRETKDENDNSLVKQLANLQDILTEERNKAITTTKDKFKMLLEVKQENERLKFQLQRTEERSNCVESGLKNDLEKKINIKNNLERKLNSVQTENNELNAILTACKESYRKKEEIEKKETPSRWRLSRVFGVYFFFDFFLFSLSLQADNIVFSSSVSYRKKEEIEKKRNAKLLEIEQSLQVEKDHVRELEMQSETLQREKDSFDISLERTENELQKNLESLQFERESVQQCQNEISSLRQQMERKKSVRDQSS